MSHGLIQLAVGVGLLLAAAVLWTPLRTLYRADPPRAILKSWIASEMILLGYFCLVVIGLAFGIRGAFDL